jgi:DNA-binding NtrC family response regulator
VKVLSALNGSSTVIRHVHHLVMKVAEQETPVLISGEQGTGKEHVAKLIHMKSAKANSPLFTLKCNQPDVQKCEEELFGVWNEDRYVPGKLEDARDGTVVLEDVGFLGPKLQNALMKSILENSIPSENGNVPLKCRIFSTSNPNLENLVKEKKFREDLYYRLATNAIYIPPLRERREDIPHLVEHFINKFNTAKNKGILGVSPDAMTALLQYTWGHNVDELENLTERIVVLKGSGTIEIADLPPRLRTLVTDNIDAFYERSTGANQTKNQTRENASAGSPSHSNVGHRNALGVTTSVGHVARQNNTVNEPRSPVNHNSFVNRNSATPGFGGNYHPSAGVHGGVGFDEPGEIDQFIKKDIDLGTGIDFYRVVEEFENRLIAEALRRTNHNKNRAAQLLSMNRTTLVEKLKKRASSHSVKMDTGRVKRNPAFTIFDGLGDEAEDFESVAFPSGKSGGSGLGSDSDRD